MSKSKSAVESSEVIQCRDALAKVGPAIEVAEEIQANKAINPVSLGEGMAHSSQRRGTASWRASPFWALGAKRGNPRGEP
jgi:hypothetical protein